MMVSTLPSSLARSRSEEMLDSLCQTDEEEMQKDSPPALPPPPVSRARLPSARGSLPNNLTDFNVTSDHSTVECLANVFDAKEENKRKEKELVQKRSSSFGGKKVKIIWNSVFLHQKRTCHL